MSPQNEFEQRIEHFGREVDVLQSRYNRFSWLRLVIFLVFLGAFGFFVYTRNGTLSVILLVVFPLPFGWLINKHGNIKTQLRLKKALKRINEEELLRLKNQILEFNEGKNFINKNHAFSYDLDLFGRNSLFQLVNHCQTVHGYNSLAKKFTHFESASQFQEKQEAIQELEQELDWRQHFEAVGKINKSKKDGGTNQEWHKPPSDFKKQSPAVYLLSLLGLVTVIAVAFFDAHFLWLIGLMSLNGVVLKKSLSLSEELTKDTSYNVKSVKSYLQLLMVLESRTFKSQYLRNKQQPLFEGNLSARTALKRLKYLLDFYHARSNMFYGILNLVFVFDFYLIYLTSKWYQNYSDLTEPWLHAIGEFEALSSLAAFAYSHPEYSYACVAKETLAVEALGHPLIPSNERVNNNFDLKNKGAVAIITGSNMSGKSTFQRTIGINLVLANCGTRICAKSFVFDFFSLYTSMRTTDNLEEHVSSFYAELQRIENLIQRAENGEFIFYMLDELLKGTNSADRHKGAKALIRQLQHYRTMGIVSTHDLELAQLEDSKTKNYSFNSRIEKNKLIFNYQLTEGVCRSFNASQLMSNIGIKLSDNNE